MNISFISILKSLRINRSKAFFRMALEGKGRHSSPLKCSADGSPCKSRVNMRDGCDFILNLFSYCASQCPGVSGVCAVCPHPPMFCCEEQSIQCLKEQSEASGEDVTSTWISNTKNNLERSLTDVDSCIHTLDNICGRLFNVEVTRTKKDETGECDGSSSTNTRFVYSS